MRTKWARAERLLSGLAAYGRQIPARGYLDVRAGYMLREYRARRDYYDERAEGSGVRYSPQLVRARTAQGLARAGIAVRPRARAQRDVHTLAFFPGIGWHPQLLAPLRELGPLSYFDYNEHGLKTADLYAYRPSAVEDRARACAAFERFAAAAARERPVDWVFVYALGIELPPSTLERVRALTGAPVVGMCLDDKQSWESEPLGGEPGGQKVFARVLDLAWTSARVACEWYLVEGGNPVFLGEGCSPELFLPPRDDSDRDVDVCFIGACYGFRPWFVQQLQRAGLQVTTAGRGWPSGAVSEEEMVSLTRRSKVILGLGGVGWSPDLKNVKGRDFDAPCVGAYVTSYNPDLAEMFRIGEEIACYSTPDEAIEVVRVLLRNPDRRRQLGERGRLRCMREHTWKHRFETVLELLGVLV